MATFVGEIVRLGKINIFVCNAEVCELTSFDHTHIYIYTHDSFNMYTYVYINKYVYIYMCVCV